MPNFSTILAASAIAAAGTGAGMAISGGKKSSSQPTAVPKAPTVDTAAQTAKSEARERGKGVARSKTILTSGLGETEEPETKKKTLLG